MFTPEFRNRLDTIIQFEPLSPEVVNRVVDKFIEELQVRLTEKSVELTIDDDAKKWLARHGYDKKMGARPMARIIQDQLKKPLADELLFGKLSEGGSVHVTLEDDKICLKVHELI
jgi:ATP-dependent Clp protease ATP-binding subunit ClpA